MLSRKVSLTKLSCQGQHPSPDSVTFVQSYDSLGVCQHLNCHAFTTSSDEANILVFSGFSFNFQRTMERIWVFVVCVMFCGAVSTATVKYKNEERICMLNKN